MSKCKEREKLLSTVGFVVWFLSFVICSHLPSFASFTQFILIKVRIPSLGIFWQLTIPDNYLPFKWANCWLLELIPPNCLSKEPNLRSSRLVESTGQYEQELWCYTLHPLCFHEIKGDVCETPDQLIHSFCQVVDQQMLSLKLLNIPEKNKILAFSLLFAAIWKQLPSNFWQPCEELSCLPCTF